jgi:UDP-N-acetylmuramoyl-tripeptide--D-alanyl-D-alanine ligase
LVGQYNKANIEAAICVGLYFGVSFDQIRNAIESYFPDNARSQLIKKGDNTIILDAYNANPSSMQVAIENFAKMEGDNKYLFLGGMMELGQDSVDEHQQLIGLLQKHQLKNIVLVGGDFAKVNHPYQFFEDVNAAAESLKINLPAHAQILIKGSRSVKMEKLLDVL